ncbi:MAG: DMT family transporter [Roseitalea porphyridii]|jgi:EamA domain-containing membrane protein RarD|uniref:DMT family transporter n=1 Tax=Roseitalea porphyridii TaxID=1852022 RepID=UPI0032F0227A
MAADPRTGVGLALACLVILGVMPVIADSRPAGTSALGFAFFLSVWQLVFSLPLLLYEFGSADRGIFGANLSPRLRRRMAATVITTSLMFGLSTYCYVLAVEKAGAVSAAIAIVSYPLFAIAWETLFLGRRKNALELTFTAVLLGALVYLGTGGTWRIEGLSLWFLFALSVPFLWSVAHVIIKEELGATPITPAQVTFFRVAISGLALGIVLIVAEGAGSVAAGFGDLRFQAHALAMGLAYYLELVLWFYAVRSIDVSLASSITVPWPALTMVLAVTLLGEPVAGYQIATFALVAASIYGLIYADAAKRRRAAA